MTLKKLSPTATITVVHLMDTVASAMVLPHLSVHATGLGFSDIQIGLIGAAFTGCQLLTSPFVGSMSDIRGRKPIMMMCFIFCSVSYFCLGLTSSVGIFLILKALLGMFSHSQFLVRSLAPDYVTESAELSSLNAKFMSISSIGTGLGASFSAAIMEKFPKSGFTVTCVVIAAFYVLTSALINMLPETYEMTEAEDKKVETIENKPRNKATAKSISMEKSLKTAVKEVLTVGWFIYWDKLLFILLIGLVINVYYNNFEIFLKTHDVSPKNLEYIMTMQRVIRDISNNLINRVNKKYVDDKDSTKRIMHIFIVKAFCLAALSAVPNINMYMFLVVPKAMIFSIARLVTLEAVLKRTNSENRGLLLGISSSVTSVSSIIAPVISGVIIQNLGINFTYYSGAAISLFGAYITYSIRTRLAKEKAE